MGGVSFNGIHYYGGVSFIGIHKFIDNERGARPLSSAKIKIKTYEYNMYNYTEHTHTILLCQQQKRASRFISILVLIRVKMRSNLKASALPTLKDTGSKHTHEPTFQNRHAQTYTIICKSTEVDTRTHKNTW